jgi:hypothetical protein
MELSWGFGGKIVLFRTQNFFIGTDIKYFSAPQHPLYFLSSGLPLNLASNFKLNCHETQFSLGMCYQVPVLVPYIYLTYLIAKIDPDPMTALVQWPFDKSNLVDAECKPLVAHRRWGMAIGATLINSGKATLAIESRMLNQNAIDANFNIRF